MFDCGSVVVLQAAHFAADRRINERILEELDGRDRDKIQRMFKPT